jgi:hypothetical protein
VAQELLVVVAQMVIRVGQETRQQLHPMAVMTHHLILSKAGLEVAVLVAPLTMAAVEVVVPTLLQELEQVELRLLEVTGVMAHLLLLAVVV